MEASSVYDSASPPFVHWSSFLQEGQRFTHMLVCAHTHKHTLSHTQRRRFGLPPTDYFPVAQSSRREQSPAIVCCVHLVDSQARVSVESGYAQPTLLQMRL